MAGRGLSGLVAVLLCAGLVHPLEAWPAAWCNSVWDFPLESAINELMGRVWSCCVCAVHSKHRPPLEVVPSTVRRLREGHAATQKGLRRSPRRRLERETDARGGDSVVHCKHCHVSVHLSESPLPVPPSPSQSLPVPPCSSHSTFLFIHSFPSPVDSLPQSAVVWRRGMGEPTGCA